MYLSKHVLAVATLLALASGAAAAADSGSFPTAKQMQAAGEKTCGNDTKCWREFAILQKTQAQNAVGLYWVKLEWRNKNKSKNALTTFPQCKTEDQECWKRLVKVASVANEAVTTLDKFDDGEGVHKP
ncbi:hypothetical protein HA052_04465 [Chromobacterium haemolyticum]|uniref:Uncharacterized protein n=1 Tax=Chromobacterium fluminis TaxID=3044269 RepID=A0ABX0KY46_9NEIS|nr:hypothetical protein [Chromobacterium haemolyticum]NHR04444.1 hypothetical protein [Chromobacterium haemolyticum]